MEGTEQKSYYEDLNSSSYQNLIEYSEIETEDLIEDKCFNATNAMRHILTCGTCHDVAVGIKYFTQFICTNIVLNNK